MNPVIVVVSRKRSDLILGRGLTLDWVSASSKYSVCLAVRDDELNDYAEVFQKFPNVFPMPISNECTDSGMYRDAVLRHEMLEGTEKVAICDDDLIFSYRDWNSTSLPKLPKEQIDDAFDRLFHELTEQTPHVGFRHRQFAQNCEKDVDKYKRIMWVHGVHRPTILKEEVTFAWKCKVMVDFHFQLSLISKGYRTAVVNSYITDDAVGPYKNSGGCNVYRNNAEREKAAYALEAMFPDAVTIRFKETPEGQCADVTVRFAKRGRDV